MAIKLNLDRVMLEGVRHGAELAIQEELGRSA